MRKLLLCLKLKRRKLKLLYLSLSLRYIWRYSVCIFSSGNLGSQLVEYKEEMYITSDCGKTWRQVGRNTENRLMICKVVLQCLLMSEKCFIIDSSVTCHESLDLLLCIQHPPFPRDLVRFALWIQISFPLVPVVPNFIWHPLICCRFTAHYVADSSLCLNVL